MDCIKVGALLRRLRLEKHMTQKQLAERMNISPKTVSKWETGAGCPDVSLLRELSRCLRVDIGGILSGDLPENEWEGGNMKNTKYYVCPVCGGLSFCTGNAAVSCCGRQLAPLIAQKAGAEDKLTVESVEDEWYITTDHPAERDNYITFLAVATGDTLKILKQYPEWEIQARIPRHEHGTLLWYSTTKGLFYQLL